MYHYSRARQLPCFHYCLIALLSAIAAFVVCREYKIAPFNCFLWMVISYAAIVLLLECGRRTRALIRAVRIRRRYFNLEDYFESLIGVYASISAVALLYWVFPEYRGEFYKPYWQIIKTLLPWVIVGAVPYVALVRIVSPDKKCGYYQLGLLLMGIRKGVERNVLITHALFWIIKGFFLPLMSIALLKNIQTLMYFSWATWPESFMEFYSNCVTILFSIDLLAAVAGYSVSLRLFATHCRSCEPTMQGWVVCLICYEPFLSLLTRLYLIYAPLAWAEVITVGWMQVAWGSLMLCLLMIYSFSSIAFGTRFSNLTNRGIVTTGPYRFTKHPAYVSKNLYWWMYHLPFMMAGIEAVRYILMMLGINTLYYLRARTEERHLMRDPDYVRYAQQMQQRCVLKKIGRSVKRVILRRQPI